MSNELEALKEDYKKLLVQVQAEMAQKNYIKKKLDLSDFLLRASNDKIDYLETSLRAANEQYQCLTLDTKREL